MALTKTLLLLVAVLIMMHFSGVGEVPGGNAIDYFITNASDFQNNPLVSSWNLLEKGFVDEEGGINFAALAGLGAVGAGLILKNELLMIVGFVWVFLLSLTPIFQASSLISSAFPIGASVVAIIFGIIGMFALKDLLDWWRGIT